MTGFLILLVIASALTFIWSTLNLCVIFYIYLRFIRPLKIRQKFVHFFYALASVLMALVMVKAIYMFGEVMINEETASDLPTRQVMLIFTSVIKCIDILLGYSVVAAMYKITASIQFVNMKITIEQRQKKKCKFYAFCAVMTSSVFLQTLFFIIMEKYHAKHSAYYGVFNAF